MTESTSKRAPKNFQKADVAIFEKAMKILGLSSSQLSEALGYADNVGAGWIRSLDRKMPMVAAKLCTFMVEEKLASADKREKVLLLRVKSEGQEASIRTIADALDVNVVEV